MKPLKHTVLAAAIMLTLALFVSGCEKSSEDSADSAEDDGGTSTSSPRNPDQQD